MKVSRILMKLNKSLSMIFNNYLEIVVRTVIFITLKRWIILQTKMIHIWHFLLPKGNTNCYKYGESLQNLALAWFWRTVKLMRIYLGFSLHIKFTIWLSLAPGAVWPVYLHSKWWPNAIENNGTEILVLITWNATK